MKRTKIERLKSSPEVIQFNLVITKIRNPLVGRCLRFTDHVMPTLQLTMKNEEACIRRSSAAVSGASLGFSGFPDSKLPTLDLNNIRMLNVEMRKRKETLDANIEDLNRKRVLR